MDNLLLDDLQFTTAPTPLPDEPFEIQPGIFWIRLHLPFALDHVNVWLIDDGEGWTLIDTGVADDRTKAVWRTLSDKFFKDKPLTRLIVTHFHPDHTGLAGWFDKRFPDAEICYSRTDWLKASYLYADQTARFLQAGLSFYRRAGADEARLLLIAERESTFSARVAPIPKAYSRLRHGDTLFIGGDAWEVIVTPGHAPEMICLWSPARNLFISADHILPSISPNVSVWPDEPDADPLADFEASLTLCKDSLPAGVDVLPSHGMPFQGLHQRIDWLLSHHEERLAAAAAACREPDGATAHEVLAELFPRALDPHQWGFAIGETIAHLNRLMSDGRVERVLPKGDRNMAYRYKAV